MGKLNALKALVATLALAIMAPDAPGASCGPPPEAAPQRRKGGESFPPLPLPATPLRRTEKKKPPTPPALVGKIEYGKIVWQTDSQGRRTSYRDWTTDPSDIRNLVRLTDAALGIRYRPISTNFEQFSYNPAEIPILYLTGHEAFELTAEQRRKLYWFINDGGFLIGDACCGSPDFFNAFVAEMKQIFPNNPLRRLAPDHPVFLCHYRVPSVEMMIEGKAVGRAAPVVEGINLGCRTAVLVTPFDLSCGWDGHEHPTGKRMRAQDAGRLGVNLVTYCLADYQLGRFLSTERVYHEEGEKTRDEFVFAQVAYDGQWDPCANGIMSLLRFTAGNSTLPVQYRRAAVKLNSAEALQYPVLYMTGHDDFQLSDAEVAGLRNYLRNGGVLFANACCGRQAFDAAFRRELARALQAGMELQPIPQDHPIYSAQSTVRQVRYTPCLLATQPNLTAPTLEAVSISGQLAVIYSRYGLGTEWDGQERPYALAYQPDDALRLGLNVLIYAMTH